MAETPDADQRPAYDPTVATRISKMLAEILTSGRLYPSEATDDELTAIISLASRHLYHVAHGSDFSRFKTLPTLLDIALAEQQRRLINKSLKQSEALAQTSQEMAKHSKDMAVEAAKSAKLARNLMIITLVASIIIGVSALVSSCSWENKQLEKLDRIERRIPVGR